MTAPPTPTGEPLRSRPRIAVLPLVGLLVGAWSVLPPYSGPSLDVAQRVEIADHVVPGVVVLALSLWALLRSRRPAPPGLSMLLAGLAVLLAGIWMVATHVPLVLQATRDEAPVGAVVYHSLPGVVVALLGSVWAGAHWTEIPDQSSAGQTDR